MENKLDAILKEIKTDKTMTTNLRSELNEFGNMQRSGSGGRKCIRFSASDYGSLDSEN